MQTASSKILLQEISGTIEKGGMLEAVVHHEIKEVGQHVLACSIQYHVPGITQATSDSLSQAAFNKFYKFNVSMLG
jgi:trafficking protein particle complex subunit 13